MVNTSSEGETLIEPTYSPTNASSSAFSQTSSDQEVNKVLGGQRVLPAKKITHQPGITTSTYTLKRL